MILYGRYDSPFVRRVAVSLHHYGLPFERRPLSVYDDFEALLSVNPLGKAPALDWGDGEVLFDSTAILDALEEKAAPERRLVPPSGATRRAVLRLTLPRKPWPSVSSETAARPARAIRLGPNGWNAKSPAVWPGWSNSSRRPGSPLLA
jgi:glutathione S-transferase